MHLGCHMLQHLNLIVLQSLWSIVFLPCRWLDSFLCHAPYMHVVCFNVRIQLFVPFSVRNRSDSIALCFSKLLSKCLWTGLKHDLLCSCFISCLKAIGDNMLLSVFFNYMLHMLVECSDDCHQNSGIVMVVDLTFLFVLIGFGLYVHDICFASHLRYVVRQWGRASFGSMQ